MMIAKGTLSKTTYAGQIIAEAVDISGNLDYTLPSDLQEWSIPISGSWTPTEDDIRSFGFLSAAEMTKHFLAAMEKFLASIEK